MELRGIIQSEGKRKLKEISPVIHLWTGNGHQDGDFVYYQNTGENRHKEKGITPCGSLDSVDINDTNEDIPAASIVDTDRAFEDGHKLCGQCLNWHNTWSEEDFDEAQTKFNPDKNQEDGQKQEQKQ